MQERTKRMMRDFAEFEHRYPGVAQAVANATPAELLAVAARHGILLDPRGAVLAQERAIDLQFGAWVLDAARASR